MTTPCPIPPAHLEHVLARIARIWDSRGPQAVAEAQAAVPRAIEAGTVVRLTLGGPFGWLLDARLDEVDGHWELEVLEDSRMAGPDHYLVREDGAREQLDTPQTMYAVGQEEAYFAHNRRVGELLRERGFRG